VKGQPYLKILEQYLGTVKNRQNQKDQGKKFNGKIISINLVNSITITEWVVKMSDFIYHEFLSFHKLDGRWGIINKMVGIKN